MATLKYDSSLDFWKDGHQIVTEAMNMLDELQKAEEAEKRQDIVGQNGNDGLHYDMHKQAKATDYQIGGDHYAGTIQPIDFIVANQIPYREANVIKYVFRHQKKNGVEDLRKARHYLNMLIEEYEKEDG